MDFTPYCHSQPSPISHAFSLMSGKENQKSSHSVTLLNPNELHFKGGFLRAQTDSVQVQGNYSLLRERSLN